MNLTSSTSVTFEAFAFTSFSVACSSVSTFHVVVTFVTERAEVANPHLPVTPWVRLRLEKLHDGLV
jgi:hypothetical protein